jgi:hypothetical protein
MNREDLRFALSLVWLAVVTAGVVAFVLLAWSASKARSISAQRQRSAHHGTRAPT